MPSNAIQHFLTPLRNIKRKQQLDASAAAARATKSQKISQELSNRDLVFGDIVNEPVAGTRRPLSPRTTVPASTMSPQYVTAPSPLSKDKIGGASTGENDGAMEPTGTGIADEAMGMKVGGGGLKDVGKGLDDDSD